jgi:uric acid-xanthine permease
MSQDGLPDRIVPTNGPKQTFGGRASQVGRRIVKKFTTKQGLLGKYDYAFLFMPNIPFMKKDPRAAPFFGLNDRMPVVLALILGFQHALAMLAGVITPPLIMSGQGGVNLSAGEQQYLVSTSLIVCGILSAVQITRFHIRGTP